MHSNRHPVCYYRFDHIHQCLLNIHWYLTKWKLPKHMTIVMESLFYLNRIDYLRAGIHCNTNSRNLILYWYKCVHILHCLLHIHWCLSIIIHVCIIYSIIIVLTRAIFLITNQPISITACTTVGSIIIQTALLTTTIVCSTFINVCRWIQLTNIFLCNQIKSIYQSN